MAGFGTHREHEDSSSSDPRDTWYHVKVPPQKQTNKQNKQTTSPGWCTYHPGGVPTPGVWYTTPRVVFTVICSRQQLYTPPSLQHFVSLWPSRVAPPYLFASALLTLYVKWRRSWTEWRMRKRVFWWVFLHVGCCSTFMNLDIPFECWKCWPLSRKQLSPHYLSASCSLRSTLTTSLQPPTLKSQHHHCNIHRVLVHLHARSTQYVYPFPIPYPITLQILAFNTASKNLRWWSSTKYKSEVGCRREKKADMQYKHPNTVHER